MRKENTEGKNTNIPANNSDVQTMYNLDYLNKFDMEDLAGRRLYINDVTNYNTKIEKFPHMIFALFIGARPMKLLSFATEEVKVKF